jgi:uncharacterized membrane protein
MIAAKRIKRMIAAVVGGTLLAFGFAVAGLLGFALVLIPAGLALLSMESQRARRWLRKAKDVVPESHPLTKKEIV